VFAVCDELDAEVVEIRRKQVQEYRGASPWIVHRNEGPQSSVAEDACAECQNGPLTRA